MKRMLLPLALALSFAAFAAPKPAPHPDGGTPEPDKKPHVEQSPAPHEQAPAKK